MSGLGFGRVIPKLQKFVPYNGKIADITEADTNKHFLDLETALSETRKIIAVQLHQTLVAGADDLYAYPNEGTEKTWIYARSLGVANWIIIADGTQRLQYSLETANDDFDVYCIGYVVEA